MFYKWTGFTPQKAAADLPRFFEQAKKLFDEIESIESPTWENIVYGLNDSLRAFCDTWSKVSHLNSVMNSPQWRSLKESWQPKVIEFFTSIQQSVKLYSLREKLLAECSCDPLKKRILELSLQSAKLSGISLAGAAKERFNDIEQALGKLSMEFYNSVIDSTAKFSFEKDGKTYTIDDAEYPETMKHCADREVREVLYRARQSRSTDNYSRISEILALRREKARLLGFKNYAELSISQKCAPSVEAVEKMIDELDASTRAKAHKDELDINPNNTLEPWDYAYEAERLKERLFQYSEADLKKCFKLEDVLGGLWNVCRNLFGINIEEVEPGAFDSWHEDVRFFNICEKGEVIANFYFDPFVRSGQKSGGAWMNEFVNYSKRRGEKPLAVIVTNFSRPDENGVCELPLRDVETLFHEFGHALQCCLTTVPEEDAAGLNLVEWDAVELASQFLENFVLDPMAGFDIPEDLRAKVKSSKNFRSASFCRRQLLFARMDMKLHINDDEFDEVSLRNIQEEEFSHFGVPFIKDDSFLCSFCHIFAGGYAAGYYSYKWSEVMSADAYGAFEECDAQNIPTLGRKFRDTILSLGGSKSAYEIFRLFRGRNPEIDAMLRQQELTDGE